MTGYLNPKSDTLTADTLPEVVGLIYNAYAYGSLI